ncbi:MAG: 16S rRNA (guanine(527)-N(7))-methyltransferase RsmG [Spirulinaceae cyanobacterium RM2_2_10]|nr:16S rRNA (guanine(527)-N(7))-methyltransferase RsmG [Spirulinaceae cyanobacterium SM2_1_0]NJO21468.1 16S rRNA (guanine(527)-N(7))-methyltransferase RsmG [Spirulinaceae cyanobacterium RM2_2_10]
MSNFFDLPSTRECWQTTLGWQPNVQQQAQFAALYAAVLAGNQQFNLTRIMEPPDFWEKHLWDSLAGLAPLEFQAAAPVAKQVIDVGTGAGFPGLPVAIACPHYQVALVDSTQKKINFIRQTTEELGLANTVAISARAEALAKQPSHRQAYDLALLRAVGSVTDCANYALPLLKPNGVAVLYRGRWSPDDAQALDKALAPHGDTVLSIEGFMTPLTQSVRHCIYIGKAGT